MSEINLVLDLPSAMITATSLGLAELAWHRSPGTSSKYHGRSIMVDLAVKDNAPDFEFLDDGGWRDANADAKYALSVVNEKKKTKTALSNNAFSVTPFSAFNSVNLCKSSGALMEMSPREDLATFTEHTKAGRLTPDEIAEAAGLPKQESRTPRLYLVIAPVELLILSNLTPEEYVYYSTHRPGKVFRQVVFTEIARHSDDLAARVMFELANKTLAENPDKKTKTISQVEGFRRMPFSGWKGYCQGVEGGLYGGDCNNAYFWSFPDKIPQDWERSN